MRWGPALLEHAIKLAAEGHSASEIADDLFQKFQIRKTRNSVIGALHRAGKHLHGRESAKSKNRRAMENRVRGRLTRKAAAPRPMSKQKAALYAIFVAGAPLPPPQPADIGRVHILDLERNHCRWLCSEPAQGMFRGEQKVEGLSYCKAHAMRAYVPPQVKTPYAPPSAAISPLTLQAVEEFTEMEPA